MADPITNLTATWTPGTGITLSWTAADDATSGSVYNIYVLEDVESVTPTWVPIAQCGATLVTTPATSGPILSPPATAYTFPASTMALLQGPGSTVAANSFAFQIVHVDYTNTESVATNISVFQNGVNQSYGVPHFQNAVILDAFGQFEMNPQDSFNEIADSVAVFMGTDQGQRTMVPDYGVPDLPLSQIDVGSIETALNDWEPRASAEITIAYNDQNQATLSVAIQGGAQ